MQDIIVIVGPTGVGKTKLSIELAKKLDAEIINGDSVAIYKELNIGSAKPTPKEREEVPHHLLDIRNVLEDYTVYDYQKDVRNLISELTKRNKRIIIVGGTGLYIKAALYNYIFKENMIIKEYEDLSNEELLARIISYGIENPPHVNNRRRLVRLLNQCENNEPLTNEKDVALYPIKVIGLTTSREKLYERINSRVDVMLQTGLLEEVESLKDKYSASRILNSGIGYKEFADYLFGAKPLDAVLEEIKKDSRHYAKRQYTFFNHQFKTNWVNVDFEDFNNTISTVLELIEK